MDMEIYIDLLKAREKKSWIFILFGVLTGIFGFYWVIIRMVENMPVRIFDWFYLIVFVFNGISITIQGFGYSIGRILGKSFIKINKNQLVFKTGIFKKETILSWSQISGIIYKPNNFIFSDSKNELYTLNLSDLGYAKVQEIKKFINSTAKEKGITVE
jgi:hypothetical protein